MTTEKLNELLEVTSLAERILILTHNDPDPDAIGSAVALRHLLVNRQNAPVKIAHRGIIGRANIQIPATIATALFYGTGGVELSDA